MSDSVLDVYSYVACLSSPVSCLRLVVGSNYEYILPPCSVSGGGAVRELYDRFYVTLTDSIPCFRLTNADSQIGCSGK